MPKRRAMMVEYTLTSDDHAALIVLLWHRSGRAEVVQLRFWLVGVVVCASVGAVAFVMTKAFGRGPGSVLGALAAPLLVLGWTTLYLLVPAIRDRVLRWSARNRSTRRFIARGPVQVWLDGEGLHIEGAGRQSAIDPRRIREVVETSDHVFLFTSPTKAIVVPRRAGPAEVKWLAAGLRAARARFDPPDPATTRTLEVLLTFEDYRAVERAPRATHPSDKAFNRYRTRWLLPASGAVLLVVAATETAMGKPPLRAVIVAVVVAGLTGVAGWVAAGRYLRALRTRRARIAYQRSGERLRLCIEPDGVRVTNQEGSGLLRWPDLTLDQTADYYFLRTGPRTSMAIPRHPGPEVDAFAALLRTRIQPATAP